MIGRIVEGLEGDKGFRYSLIAILGAALGLRLCTLWLFPYIITEDSDGYLFASEFFNSRNADYRIYLAYRYFGYPALIWLFKAAMPLPFHALMLAQVLVSTATCGLLAWCALGLGIRRALALAVAAWYAGYSRAIMYATVIAPETWLIFFVVAATWLLLHQLLGALAKAPARRLVFVGAAQGLVLGAALVFRETFIVALAAVVITQAAFLFWRAREGVVRRAEIWSLIAVCALASSTYVASMMTSRHLLGTSRFRPYAFPWAIGLDCYYMDSQSRLYAGLKQQLASGVSANKARLGTWEFQFGETAGYDKGTRCVDNGYLTAVQQYIQTELGVHDSYEAYLTLQDVLAQLAAEGVTTDLPHYFRWWLVPEVLRAFFPLEPPRSYDSFKRFTTRELTEEWPYPLLVPELRDAAPYALLRNERPTLQWTANQFLQGITFQRYWIFSLVFLLATPLVFLQQYWSRSEDAVGRFGLAFLMAYVWGTIVETAAIVWFYERYTLYFTFALLLVTAKSVDLLTRSRVREPMAAPMPTIALQ